MPRRWTAAALAALAAGLAGCDSSGDRDYNDKPSYVGDVVARSYDGESDDLLTAGLGAEGLAATAPALSSPPTAAELRRNAIHVNYRALVDVSPGGGYGRLYGPNVAPDGSVSGDGKIAGTETIAYSDDGTGRRNVTLMVQVPESFDPARACITTAIASGSRGIYGAISVAEWGLKRGCAVAFTDKGTGTSPHDLQNDTVALIDGTRAPADEAGDRAFFRAELDAGERAAFNAATPNRYAIKHAHSQQNPEKDWGRATLQAIEFAFWVLNERYGANSERGRLVTLRPDNTLVIATSVSNGGAAALAAAELDDDDWIDGVAVAEPAVELPADAGVAVRRGATEIPVAGRHLYDYFTYANLYQGCALGAASVADAPFLVLAAGPRQEARCAALQEAGLLEATTPAAQAAEALQKLRDYGWEPESDLLHASHFGLEAVPAVTVAYANAYSRASVADNLCGYSYSGVDGAFRPAPVAEVALEGMFATGNGVPPSAGITLINNASLGGPLRDAVSISPSSGVADFNTDGALCLRELLTGSGTAHEALLEGIDETRRSGDLQGKPALIVQGRADALLPVNHTARPYTALNKRVEGSASRLSYIEVENAQHFDGFLGFPGFDTRYVPLHLYLQRALDTMWNHLRNDAELPPSQVVRTTPRGGTAGAAPALEAAQVPSFTTDPDAADLITMDGSTIVVPE